MLPLQYAGKWRLASLLLLIVVLAGALMPVLWFWDNRAGGLDWFSNVDKWLHGVSFFVLALWFAGMFARPRYVWIAIFLLLFGMVIEAIQYKVSYRTASWGDVAANATGILVGMGIALAGIGGWCQRFEKRWTGAGT